MTRKEFIESLREQYSIAQVLSNKNDSSVLRLCHREIGGEIVLRSYPHRVEAYEKLKTLHHPNMPEVLDIRQMDDGQIIIEEFINGITVAEVLKSDLYTYGGARQIIEGVAFALETLHGMGIVHRDIKPENIITNQDDEVFLLDLNASRKHSPQKNADTVTLGTIGYAPPEQFGISQSDPKSDIYALGVLLNVMLTGVHPSERLAKGKAGKIVLRCTQISPEKRFPSVEKLIEAL